MYVSKLPGGTAHMGIVVSYTRRHISTLGGMFLYTNRYFWPYDLKN